MPRLASACRGMTAMIKSPGGIFPWYFSLHCGELFAGDEGFIGKTSPEIPPDQLCPLERARHVVTYPLARFGGVPLDATNSSVRTDNVGFQRVFSRPQLRICCKQLTSLPDGHGDRSMPVDMPPPQPPSIEKTTPNHPRGSAPIADVREQFSRKGPQTPEDEVRSREFIAGKIEMIRRDLHMSEAEKAAAIADLQSRR